VDSKADEDTIFPKTGYRARDFHIDPALFKHFERAHHSQVCLLLIVEDKVTGITAQKES
jgi:hypothetical protein